MADEKKLFADGKLQAQNGKRYRLWVHLDGEPSHEATDDELRKHFADEAPAFSNIEICGAGARREVIATWRDISGDHKMPAIVTHAEPFR